MKLKTRLKDVTKAFPPIQSRGLRPGIAAVLILLFTLYILHSPAAEPLCWERRPNRPAPAQFDTFHGETLEFRCAFEGFGALPFTDGSDVRLWYQTNGMGSAWWSVPATVASNTVAAAWPPSADPGAERVAFFFGAPSNAYAAAQVRFRNSPGGSPNALPPPTMVLDFRNIAYTNAPWTTPGDVSRMIAQEASVPGGYETVSNRAMSAIQSLAPATNYTDAAVVAATNALSLGPIADNSYRLDEMESITQALDAMVERLEGREHITTNAVCNIVTNETSGQWSVFTNGAYAAEWTVEIYHGDDYDPGTPGVCYLAIKDENGEEWYGAEWGWPFLYTDLSVRGSGLEFHISRPFVSRNALGLARLSDVVAATNGLGLATTNYTDAAITAATNTLGIELRAEMGADIGALRNDLTTGAVEVASAKRAYEIGTTNGVFGGDWIVDSINELKGGERLTTNNVCNIVTATVEKAVDRWSVTTNDAPVLGSAVKFIYQRDANRDLTYRDIYVYFPGYVPPVGYFDAGDMQRVMFHQFSQFAGVHTNDIDVSFTISLSNIPTEEYRYLSGATARLRRITSINALSLARLSDLPPLTNGLIGADFIATNNPAFVTAVTNCLVAIAASDAEALAEWGIYGGGGTIGALLAALAAAVAALKKKKMPLYPVGGTGNPVNATLDSGVLTVSPFAMAAYTPTASAAFSVAMGALPSDLESGKARDAVLVIDCTSLTDGQEPTMTWGTNYHPRTDAATDFACAAGVRNVYYISEYASGEFAVGGWQETAGGNA